MLLKKCAAALAVMLFVGTLLSVNAQNSEFTYQGSLKDGPNAANGSYDFEFLLFDAVAGGSQQGPTLTRNGVTVTNGIFAVTLDFGNQFPGTNRFLEIRVRTSGAGGHTILAPRQAVNSTPYAVKSLNADNAGNLGGVAANQYLQTNGNGSGLTSLNATNIISGTLNNARLSVVPIANGGTGAATQNFVDLSTTQTIGGFKTFTSRLSSTFAITGINNGASTLYGVLGQMAGDGAALTSTGGVVRLAPGVPFQNSGFRAGVLGIGGGSANIPVIGIGDFEGVRGINTAGVTSTVASYGALGYTDTIAVFGSGNFSVTGTKSFVEPHPTDPDKVIRYVSLEGPEAGTYFRGRGRFVGKRAVIDVPENFRMVTEEEGLSIQVTPIGKMATVAVMEISLNQIVVEASENVEFFYTVNGVRLGFANFQVIGKADREFIPSSPEARMPTSLSEGQKRKLIATGVYNRDGTPNLDTARKFGWDKYWLPTKKQEGEGK